MININTLDFDKLEGLIPAVIIDSSTEQVLMLGFMNKESLQKTLELKKVTFYSRSRKSLWTKGETSGNYLEVVRILPDCDNDTLLIYSRPLGNTCHTGNYSCFNIEKNNLKFLSQLFELIKTRKKELPEGSYTTKLFKTGADRIIQKVGEEAVETIVAAKNRNKNEIVNEVSDLIYHLFVMLSEQNIELCEIIDVLEERHNK